ncbi:CPBP family intramembrane glutamic endopeptidase [Dehalogenimonas alkenigignens]|uniref:CPBP family intramembrane glutamic endopeptidase n=1 Tax=Dehalogenimonas alkenigignens TaxID=1217799 RepID=UPI0010579A73|nr:type II CAAX endopeptidase family protein [Dehalogenimonas alkenigignens]
MEIENCPFSQQKISSKGGFVSLSPELCYMQPKSGGEEMAGTLRGIFTVRWKPTKDLAVMALSIILVVGALYTATVVVTPDVGGGMPYFFLYAGLMAVVLGVGLPLFWMVIVRKRPLADLGLTFKNLRRSLALQTLLAILLYITGLKIQAESFETVIPLVALALCIGFFEAVFWRGWVLNRLEEAFGILPGIVAGSVLYSIYHVGYGMALDEMVFLFFIGIMFAVVFKLTGSIFILWPVFQPMGQLITLSKEGLDLPLIASVGFIEALAVMVALVWLAQKYLRRYQQKSLTGNPSFYLKEAVL